MYAESNITVGQRTKSEQTNHMTDRFAIPSDKMSGQKRQSTLPFSSASSSSSGSKNLESSSSSDMVPESNTSSEDVVPEKKAKRQVAVATFEKWQRNYDRDHQTLSWLRCEKDKNDKSLVALLWCSVCRKYRDNIRSMKNFSNAWVSGSENHRTSNVLDHVACEQHQAAMSYLRVDQAKARNEPITSYTPIARALLMLDEAEKGRMRRKFDLCYLMAKEGLAFEKYVPLYELESRHGIELGHAYKNAPSAKLFTHYIAEAQRQQLMQALSKTKFYSFLMDGSTDAGNIEQELVVLQLCKIDDASEEIKSYTRYLSVASPKSVDARGLLRCLSHCLSPLGIEDILDQKSVLETEGRPVLIGGGTDGASANISEQNGMMGLMQSAHPWLVWAWCYAHRLELACKNALTSTTFKSIEEMLLRLYFLYEKSPKKIRELEEIVEDLKEVFEFPPSGNKPIRSQGSRWINHKRKALQRVIDRYGAYISHLSTLTEDKSLKPEDRAKIKGYLKKWMSCKTVIGCAIYTDILKSPSLLSQSLQGCEMDTVLGIKNILKSAAALKSLSRQDTGNWPTVKLVLERMVNEGDGKFSYQGSELTDFGPEVRDKLKEDAMNDLTRMEQKIKERLEWSNIKILRSLLVFLDTQSWAKQSQPVTDTEDEFDSNDDCSLAEVKKAVDHIASHFRLPLETKGVSLFSLQDEVEEAVEYARAYLDISHTEYRKVWYKLYSCPDAKKWPNILSLCELSFSLPFSNSRVEQIFSSLKTLKTIRRTHLKGETLSDLLEIYVEGPALSLFCPDQAIDLWWSDCATSRRVHQEPRKEYQSRLFKGGTDQELIEERECLTLELWDDWFSESGSEEESD